MSKRILVFIALLAISVTALVISYKSPTHKCWVCENLDKQNTANGTN